MDYISWISTALGALLMWLSFALLRKYFPRRSTQQKPTQQPLSESEYQKAQLGFGLVFVACLFLVGSLLYQGYSWWLRWKQASLTVGETLIVPDPWSWYLGIGFAALGIGGMLSVFLMNAFLGEEKASLFAEESSRRSRMNVKKVFIGLYSFIIIVAVFFLTYISQNAVHLHAKGVSIYKFMKGEPRIYALDTVKEISFHQYYLNRQGKLMERPYYKVTFSDGSTWMTKQFPFGIEEPLLYTEAFQHLAQRAQIKIKSSS